MNHTICMNQERVQHVLLGYVLQDHPGGIVAEPNVTSRIHGSVRNGIRHPNYRGVVFRQEQHAIHSWNMAMEVYFYRPLFFLQTIDEFGNPKGITCLINEEQISPTLTVRHDQRTSTYVVGIPEM